MPKFVVKAGEVLVDGSDISTYIRSAAVQMDKDKVDATGLNGNGVKEEIPGLATEGFEFEIATDPAVIDALLFPIYRNETVVDVSVEVDTPDGPGNTYSSPCRLFNYHPVDGNVGQLSTTKVTFASTEGIAQA